MSRPSTIPIAAQKATLTTRQTLDARTAALRFANKLMTRLSLFALGYEEDPETCEFDDEGMPIEGTGRKIE